MPKANDWPFYDIRNHVGFLRTMQVRLCTTGELMVNIVVGENDEEKIKMLMDICQCSNFLLSLLCFIHYQYKMERQPA
ncbi:MAG: hypothetical protein V9F01_03395 [Chitinophagaceae bacterium]